MTFHDESNVQRDIKTLHDIIERQGYLFLLEVVANGLGRFAETYKIKALERCSLIDKTVQLFSKTLSERV
jgi:hypothetical protein